MAAKVVRRGISSVSFGVVIGWPLVGLAVTVDVVKLIINADYWYRHAQTEIPGVDPVTGFALGLALIWIVGYLLNGLRQRSVWAAMGLTVAMPLLWVVMVDGLAAAIVHQQMYFEQNPVGSLWLEVVPACILAVIYGVQALANYHQRFRRIR